MAFNEFGSHELSVFGKLIKILSHTSLEEIFEAVIDEVPKMIGSGGCSIFLSPEFVPQFDGTLSRNGTLSQVNSGEEIIVLAATSQSRLRELIGRAYYGRNEGLTGHVYATGEHLNIKDVTDKTELLLRDKNLTWVDGYGESWELYDDDEKKPLLVIPLASEDSMFGVIKYPAPKGAGPFSEFSEKAALMVSGIISTAIRNSWMQKKQNRTILSLIEISRNKKMRDVLKEVTRTLPDLLNCSSAQIYKIAANQSIFLDAENGNEKNQENLIERYGIIEWVMRTGKPLLITDLRFLQDQFWLEDTWLDVYSDGKLINERDRWLVVTESSFLQGQSGYTTLIVVPIKLHEETVSVLAVHSRYESRSYKRHTPFSREDLERCRSLAQSIALAMEIQLERESSNLLIDLGYLEKYEDLVTLVVETIPRLFYYSSDCSVYLLQRSAAGQTLELQKTSRLSLRDAKTKVRYRLGEGKTGLCGLLRSTVIVNDFGEGGLAESRIQEEVNRIFKDHPKDIVRPLLDSNGLQVGIVQLRRGKKVSFDLQKRFTDSAVRIRLERTGLQSAKQDLYKSKLLQLPFSFVAIPIMDENDLYGVITLARSIPEKPFAHQEITLLESIAGRLAALMGQLRLQEQRGDLLVSLGHELNTPITGILADSENLVNEIKDKPHLIDMARNNLEQVARLQLQTETIIGVLADPGSKRSFELVGLYEILRSARELFSSQAEMRGCSILNPKSVGEREFPYLEVLRFEFDIAVKNIVHNAVKYSYAPRSSQEKDRYVNIWGIWENEEREFYKINIQNYGVGILPEEIEKRTIFKTFMRGENANDRRRTGAGFGLAYASKIIEEIHGGRIDVTSIPTGAGKAHLTTFTITIPALRIFKRK